MPRSYSFDGGFPRSPSKESFPYGFKEEVQKKVDEFIDTTLKCLLYAPMPELGIPSHARRSSLPGSFTTRHSASNIMVARC